MEERIILHCDCNSFFASVETVLEPSYKNVPMAVCGDVENRHGIILAKNELAKKYGIVTAETVFSAKKKCPRLVLARPHYDQYMLYSKRANEIYARYTDMIEPFGIDESWLDVTASKFFGSGMEIAEKIRNDIKNELGITVSIGVSFNKVFAKLGSDYKKPDAITEINRDNFQTIVYPLPVSDLLFVGKRTAEALKLLGIRTIGDLALASPDILSRKLGKAGEMLSVYARGEDKSPVEAQDRNEAKSIGNGYTFKHDLVGREECRTGINYLAEEIGTKLRRRGLKCATVQLSIKDEYLRTIQRNAPQNPPTDISSEIAETAFKILCREWSADKPIRMITVTATNLVRKEGLAEQIDMFGAEKEEKREKNGKREIAVDEIRKKFGTESILRASVIESDIGIYDKMKNKK
ncbi:MAG: DNA polymerase IV [Ruminococcaceae bacterium]|nr:DNA polymerase IV [Oscillospiraceae bacterium]